MKNRIYFLMFITLLTGCASPSSTILLTGEKRAPVASSTVKVLPSVPANTEMIAVITSNGKGGTGRQNKLNTALVELKRQAALLGANAIVLENESINEMESSKASKGINIQINLRPVTLKAKALFVNNKN